MPYPIQKQERYANFGGLNNKISRYLTGQQEVIRLVNYDFSRPGSLTKRPDTSEFLPSAFGPHITSIYEFTKLNRGASYIFIAGTSGLFSNPGASPCLFGMSQQVVGANVSPTPTYGATTYIDYANFDNSLWASNIGVSLSADPTNTSFFGRYGETFAFTSCFFWQTTGGGGVLGTLGSTTFFSNNFFEAQMTVPPSVVVFGNSGLEYTAGGGYFVNTRGYRYRYAFLNNRGILGPAHPVEMAPYLAVNATEIRVYPQSLASAGVLTSWSRQAPEYIVLFREELTAADAALRADVPAITTAVFKVPVYAQDSVTFQIVDDGTAGATWLLPQPSASQYKPNSYYGLRPGRGATTGFVDLLSGRKVTGWPTIINTYNNMMFFAGLSEFPSRVFWSQLGVPEWVDNEDYSDIQTSDGDYIRCLIPYDGNLVIAKSTSIHVLNGSSPDDLAISEKSASYGFINNRSACVFQDTLWGIDGQGRGIVQFSGANVDIVSDKVQDIFLRINLNAAETEAWMLHVKSRNEVWCGIPIDDSNTVNTIIVFDYYSKGWTTYEGLSVTAVTIARGTLDLPQPVMGFSNGSIRNLNPVFAGMESITAIVRAPFITNYGWSATETYRRLFIDTDPILGATYAFAVNLYLDQSDTPSYQTTLVVSSPQERAEFGLPGKGMSVELIESSDQPLRLNGYTVGSRFQRNV